MFLYQEQEGFLFNSDTHFLYAFIDAFHPKGEVLDVGSGCGILGLLIARDHPVSLTQIDPLPHNILLNAQNARVNQIETTLIEGDLLHHPFKTTFDMIVSNPPYYPEGASRSENPLLHKSRYNIHLPPEALIAKAATLLKPRGRLLFCYDPGQLPRVQSALEAAHLRLEDLRFVHGTPDKPASLVLLHARKNSRAPTRIHPPLIHFSKGVMSEEVKKIYRLTRTYSIKCKTT